MKAIVCHAPRDLRLDPVLHHLPGPGELAVRVAYGGICGSDLHYFQHGGFGTVRLQEPMALGHEVSGVIDAVGQGVAGFRIGQRIAISPSRPCGQCRFCQLGQQNHCLDMRFYGSAMRFPHVQGAFCEQLVIGAVQAHAIGDQLPLALAALAEPLSVGLHAIARAGGVMGKQVLVTGCGPIGSLLIGALRRAGAARIVAADIADLPLDCARKMGADDIVHLGRDPQGLAPWAQGKGQFDAMFEASGSALALLGGLDMVAPRGVIVAIGLGGDVSLPMNKLVTKELELRGTFRFHQEFASAVRFLDQGLIDPRPVISHRLPLDDALDAFNLACDKSQAMKVLIEFPALSDAKTA
jgi:L-idonate 5-dehydrogenase